MLRAMLRSGAMLYRSRHDIKLIKAAFSEPDAGGVRLSHEGRSTWRMECGTGRQVKVWFVYAKDRIAAVDAEAPNAATDTVQNMLAHVNSLLRRQESPSNTLFHNFLDASLYIQEYELDRPPVLHALKIARKTTMQRLQARHKTVEIRRLTPSNMRMRTNDTIEFFHFGKDGLWFRLLAKIQRVEVGIVDQILDRVWRAATPCEDADSARSFVQKLHEAPLREVMAIHVKLDDALDAHCSDFGDRSSVKDPDIVVNPAARYADIVKRHLARIFVRDHQQITRDAMEKTMLHSVIAVIAQGDKVLMSATNALPTPDRPYYEGHAERQAIDKLFRNNRRVERKVLLKGLTLYSLRFTQEGNLANARPCFECSKVIKAIPWIKEIVYSNDDGQLVGEAAQNFSADVPKSSAGRAQK